MSDRDTILSTLRQRAKGTRHHPGPGPVPARGKVAGKERAALFTSLAQGASASVAQAATAAEVPSLIAEYLRQNNLPPRLRLSPDPRVKELDWASQPLIDVNVGAADAADLVSVTPAFAGIAETGTVALASGGETPATLNFLPETHIVVMKESELVGTFEDLWKRARDRFGENWPRTINLVTGPSRSADIEQTLLMGAHGPKRLHIVLVND